MQHGSGRGNGNTLLLAQYGFRSAAASLALVNIVEDQQVVDSYLASVSLE